MPHSEPLSLSAKKKAGKNPKNESTELEEEFDLIESIIERLAEHNGVDAEVIWEDLETLTEDELYAFAVTSEPIMEDQGVAEGSLEEVSQQTLQSYRKKASAQKRAADDVVSGDADDETWKKNVSLSAKRRQGIDAANKRLGVAEDWQKANKRDKTDGMSQKAVNAYRRENPGSKLKTAVTTKPSKSNERWQGQQTQKELLQSQSWTDENAQHQLCQDSRQSHLQST
jgi:hypothetical protein